MTRENKLALVLGFGLLLLAGILVSDYLSAGHRVNEDPLLATSTSEIPDSRILRAQRGELQGNQRNQQIQQDRRQTSQSRQPEPLEELTMGAPKRTTPGARTSSSGRSVGDADVHYVRKGESLSSISTRFYGNPGFAEQIARLNNLGDPNRVKVGTRLILPKSFGRLMDGSTARADTASTPPPTPRSKTVKVREGETLSDIAKRELGDGNKWRALWKANKNVIPNPDRLSPGIVLQLPTT